MESNDQAVTRNEKQTMVSVARFRGRLISTISLCLPKGCKGSLQGITHRCPGVVDARELLPWLVGASGLSVCSASKKKSSTNLVVCYVPSRKTSRGIELDEAQR